MKKIVICGMALGAAFALTACDKAEEAPAPVETAAATAEAMPAETAAADAAAASTDDAAMADAQAPDAAAGQVDERDETSTPIRPE